MERKENPIIVVDELTRGPARELKAMLEELEGRTPNPSRACIKTARWGRRFVASGKSSGIRQE